MRPNKLKKTARNLALKNRSQDRKARKKQLRAKKEKYQAWFNLPYDQWTDARKAYIDKERES